MQRVPLPASMLAITMLSGCYTYVPMIRSAPTAGERYVLEVTDQGRVALADRMGSGVLRVEGTVAQMTNDAYIVNVASVEMVDGSSSHWSGEKVTIPAADVSRIQERVFSRGRTAVAVGAAAVALGVFIASRSLHGGGSPPVSGNGGGGGGGT